MEKDCWENLWRNNLEKILWEGMWRKHWENISLRSQEKERNYILHKENKAFFMIIIPISPGIPNSDNVVTLYLTAYMYNAL